MAKEKAIVKPDDKPSALAVTDDQLATGFGAPEDQAPIELAWPEIKMTKTTDFVMPNDDEVKELVGHIVFAQKSRAYYAKDFDGNPDPPDCACSDVNKILYPDFGDDRQNEKCLGCEHAEWTKGDDDKSHMACGESLNVILMLDGSLIPYYMRIRSTSIGKKSSLAKFFLNCKDANYALGSKFQTVKVKLTLEKTKINNFDTSYLMVEKIETLKQTDERLSDLLQMFAVAKESFEVRHEGQTQVEPEAVDQGENPPI
jgi:hypothetical protein